MTYTGDILLLIEVGPIKGPASLGARKDAGQERAMLD